MTRSLRRGDTALDADRIKYFADTDEVEATGNVRLRIGGDEVTGPRLRLRVGDSTGIFENPRFKLAPRDVLAPYRGGATVPVLTAIEPPPQISVEGRGEAAAVRFEGDGLYRASNARFTTCKPGQDDWFIEAGGARHRLGPASRDRAQRTPDVLRRRDAAHSMVYLLAER